MRQFPSTHSSRVNALVFSDSRPLLASAGADGKVLVWALDSDEDPLVFGGHKGQVLTLAFSETGRDLYSGGSDQTIRKWSTDLQELAESVCHAFEIRFGQGIPGSTTTMRVPQDVPTSRTTESCRNLRERTANSGRAGDVAAMPMP
jgi:WD40 repeat protein